jgi:cobalamin biosynthesis protein CobW
MVDGEALAAGSVVADPAALEAQRLADPSLDHASAIDELFAEQLEAADLVLMSRADCLGPDAMQAVHQRLKPLLRPGAVVLPVARGNVDPELVLGLERRASNARSHDPEGQHHVHGHHEHGHNDHEHYDHEHHDHSHVAIEALALELPGAFGRQALEQQLAHLLRQSAVIRLKGRLWLPGKARPLQIQAVGPRLECWFEPGGAPPTDADIPSPGLELVVLGFQLDQGVIEASLQQANQLVSEQGGHALAPAGAAGPAVLLPQALQVGPSAQLLLHQHCHRQQRHLMLLLVLVLVLLLLPGC